MAMLLLLDEFQTFSGLKSGGVSYHPDKGVCHFSPHILAMTSSSDALLDHIADYLQFISNTQLFWFTLNTSMTMERLHVCVVSHRAALVSSYHASWLSHSLLSSSHCATLSSSCCASWLLHHLSPPSHCAALSSPFHTSWLSHCLSPSSHCAPPSCQLVAPACCRIASPCPLVAPRATLLSSRRTCWLLLRRLSTRRPLVVSLSHCAPSYCLVAPAGCRAVISCHPLVAPPSCPLIVPAGCCVACPCTALSSSCLSSSPTPSNAIKRCCRHQSPPPPPPLDAVSIIHHCQSCRPLPPSITNTYLRPSPLSNADTRRRHTPPLMTIYIVAS